ncbi:unnamed protein product [marine sediment metagenome]|uniref:Mannosyl-glycoprotein endo-beta-N-acetylglucosamidase-like domain-containing protein n=1 Tax=marine sediment metagenome TaxID=412755 RepID=X1SL94_9ZZZZ
MAKRPDFISEADWSLVEKYCTIYNFTPYLIAAIGWHETHWGRLGAGVRGWILGYGYFPGSTVKEKYRGLENQLKGACPMIAKYFKFPVTQSSCINFAIYHWKPSAPTAWGKSVYSIYSSLEKGITPQVTPTNSYCMNLVVPTTNNIIEFIIPTIGHIINS